MPTTPSFRLVWIAVATSLGGACGGGSNGRDDGETVCGDGTVLIAGQCLPVDPSSSDGGGAATTGVDATGSTTAGGTTPGESSGAVDDTGTGDASTGSAPTALELHDVVLHDNPEGLADWPVTTTITRLEFREGGVYVEFSKKDGAERWPDIVPPGWDGPLQYTLGLTLDIDGQWHGSAAMQYWYGLDVQGGNVALDDQIAVNWYYDARWGELAGVQPAQGEIIGVFLVAGNARGVLDGSQSPVQERSDIVLVPMPGIEGATHDF